MAVELKPGTELLGADMAVEIQGASTRKGRANLIRLPEKFLPQDEASVELRQTQYETAKAQGPRYFKQRKLNYETTYQGPHMRKTANVYWNEPIKMVILFGKPHQVLYTK
jgi:hypothetical protein